MPTFQLFADLDYRRLTNAEGSTLELPRQVLGDTLVCQLRFLEHAGDGVREKQLQVRSVKASLGKVLEPPAGGVFRLEIAGEETAEIAFDATAESFGQQIAAAVTAAGLTVVLVSSPAAGCWVLVLDGADPAPAEVKLAEEGNSLVPESFVRVREYQEAGVWKHEVRLIQVPLAFNSGFARVLPPEPTVRRIHGGQAPQQGVPALNELQALTISPAFRGTYFLRWNLRRSSVLGVADGPDEIAAALNGMWEDGAERVRVSNPVLGEAYIEFIGELKASSQEIITVEVDTFPPGVVTIELPLDRAVLATALRVEKSVTVPLEIEVRYVEDGEDPEDSEIPSKIFTACQQEVTIVREQIWAELATTQPVDWLRPPQRRSYVPYTPDQIITGQQHYVAAFGDGTALEYSFEHNLGTSAGTLLVRQNVAGGRALGHPGEYEVFFASANELVIKCAVAPEANGLVLTFTTAGPVSAFQAHTHTIGQVVGLRAELDEIEAQLAAVLDRLPFTSPTAPDSGGSDVIEISVPDRHEAFFGRFEADSATSAEPKLIRGGGLLPAVHDTSVTTISSGELGDPAEHAGEVWQYTGTGSLLVPGGLGRRGDALKANGYAASDGRVWYPVAREGTTRSYYPTDFERELFMFAVDEKMLRPGRSLSVIFWLGTQTLAARTRGQWLLVIETGTAPQATGSAPAYGVNLADVTWSGRLFAQRIIVSGVLERAKFGCSIRRSLSNVLAADVLLYGDWEAAASGAPTSANFVLRARLIQWDTEDGVSEARGAAYYGLTDVRVGISGS